MGRYRQSPIWTEAADRVIHKLLVYELLGVNLHIELTRIAVVLVVANNTLRIDPPIRIESHWIEALDQLRPGQMSVASDELSQWLRIDAMRDERVVVITYPAYISHHIAPCRIGTLDGKLAPIHHYGELHARRYVALAFPDAEDAAVTPDSKQWLGL